MITRDLRDRIGIVESQVIANRLQQGRLPNSGSALEDQESALPFAERLQRVGHNCQLIVAPDDTCDLQAMKSRFWEYLGGIDLAGGRSPIPTRLFCVIESGVGCLQQTLAVLGVFRCRRNPNAQRDRNHSAAGPHAERPVAGSLQQPSGNLPPLTASGIGEHHRELVAAVANGHPLVAHDLREQRGHPGE